MSPRTWPSTRSTRRVQLWNGGCGMGAAGKGAGGAAHLAEHVGREVERLDRRVEGDELAEYAAREGAEPSVREVERLDGRPTRELL